MSETPNSARVLVVDDDPHVRELVREFLVRDGWSVHVAASGREALDYCRSDLPDVVVLDNLMPGMCGMDVARCLIEEGLSVPVILFSAHLDVELRTECHLLGLIPVDKINVDELVLTCDSLWSKSPRFAEVRPGRPNLVAPLALHAA